MRDGIRGILILGGVLCLLSLVGLLWLAWRTTDGMVKEDSLDLPTWKRKVGDSSDKRETETGTWFREASITEAMKALKERLERLRVTEGVVPNELLVSFSTREALERFLARAKNQGLEVLYSDPRLLAAQVRYPTAESMAREMRDHASDYSGAGPNYYAWVPALQNESQVDAANAGGHVPFGDSGLSAIGAARDRADWGRGVSAAILDTGITAHDTLAKIRLRHMDLVKDGQTPNGHGTAMASLIAGEDKTYGGVAPATDLLDIRVANINGESTTALVAQGIMEAVDAGAQLINISLGSAGDALLLRQAVAYALKHGVVIVAAAGNEQQSSLSYPAAYEGVISVGAVDANHVQAYFSNSGKGLTLAAPGVGIVSAYNDNRMVVSSGTSQATALTSGVVAAMLGWGYAATDISSVLTQHARATGAPVEQVGAGVLQVPKR
jgi:thermitase